MRFGADTVDVLVQSRPGDENQRKPVVLWVQGSLPRPVAMYDERSKYGVFPFNHKPALAKCHFVVIGKPGIPLIAGMHQLNASKTFVNKVSGAPPAYYCQRNHLDYYVSRDVAVLKYLKKQPWVDARHITAIGHSEGSTIVARLAATPGAVSRVAYLSGNPLGRMLSNVADARLDADSAGAEQMFQYWAEVVAKPADQACTPGDTNLATFSFSEAPMPYLLRAKVPIFIGYGTRDKAVLSDDYLRLEAIRLKKANFTFHAYEGREHNFFGFKNGALNYDDFGWDKVGEDVLRWAGVWP